MDDDPHADQGPQAYVGGARYKIRSFPLQPGVALHQRQADIRLESQQSHDNASLNSRYPSQARKQR